MVTDRMAMRTNRILKNMSKGRAGDENEALILSYLAILLQIPGFSVDAKHPRGQNGGKKRILISAGLFYAMLYRHKVCITGPNGISTQEIDGNDKGWVKMQAGEYPKVFNALYAEYKKRKEDKEH